MAGKYVKINKKRNRNQWVEEEIHKEEVQEVRKKVSDTLTVDYRLSMEEVKNLIPVFSPGVNENQTVHQWLNIVEGMKNVYSWSDQRTMLYASLRLDSAAKFWYQCRQNELWTWEMFKTELSKSFPTISDESAVHRKLLTRQRKKEEPVEYYFYEVLSLAKNANLNNETTINYIISGLNDKNLSNVLLAANLKSPNELLERIKVYESIRSQEQGRISIPLTSWNSRFTEGIENKKFININTQERGKFVNRCFGCGKIGHKRSECRNNTNKANFIRCFNCGKTGHRAIECQSLYGARRNECVEPVRKMRKLDKENNELYQNIEIEGKIMPAFIDLGSDCCTIRKKDCPWRYKRWNTTLTGFAGGKCETIGKIYKNIHVGNIQKGTEILVVDDEDQDVPVIVGMSLLGQPGIKIIKQWKTLQIEPDETSRKKEIEFRPTTETPPQMRVIRKTIQETDCNIEHELNSEQTGKFIKLVNKYRECFSQNISELGKTSWVTMQLKLKEDKVIRNQPYTIPYHLEKEMEEIIEDLKKNKIIEDSTSEYASPALLVRKKDGSYRMCVDYRRLNAITQRENFPTPNIEHELNQTAGGKFYSSLDLMNGYYQVPIDYESRKYTAFITTQGHYQFCRMPFGLTNAPACFLRLMNLVRIRLNNKKVRFYLDDILIVADSIVETLEILDSILQVLKEANLTINLKKCVFFAESITYLGHEIGNNIIKPGAVKTRAIENYPELTSIKEVRQFLGLTGYFRRFIKEYALKALPLNKLLKKDAVFKWEEEERNAFNTLKECLVREPILVRYEPDASHELHTDACSSGLAGILLQNDCEGRKQAVSYYSRCTTELEKKYSSYELEALAVVESLERFKYYLLGKKFTIVTDCNALKLTQAKKNLVPRIARWWLKIQEFDFEIKYRPGKQMSHVDTLSRTAKTTDPDIEEVGLNIMTITIKEDDWVATLQTQDEKLKEIIDILHEPNKQNNNHKNFDREYEIKKGRLYKKTAKGIRLVVPKGLRWRIIRSAHDDLGHGGVERTIDEVKKNFWFPRMQHIIKKYIDGCIECLYTKRHKDESRYILYTPEIKSTPFHTVHIDHLGPYPKSLRGNMHLIGVIDSFSKFIILKAVKNTKTIYVIRLLEDISQYVGIPQKIITDRGTAFSSKLFEQFCLDNEIHHVKTAVKTPRANGQIERYFRTISTSISAMTKREDGRDWDVYITSIQWGLNSMQHKITKQSAFKLILGFEPKHILQNKLINAIHADGSDDEDDIPLNELRKQIALKMNEQRTGKYEEFNKSRIPPTTYNEGDLVLIRMEQQSTGGPKKHAPRYKGPYMVKKELGNDRYVITDCPALRITRKSFESVYAADRMRPWCRLENYVESDDYQTEESDGEDSQ